MDEQVIREKALTVVEASKAITITNSEEYTNAAEFLKQVKSSSKAITDFFKDIKAQAAAAHKAICDKEKGYLSPLNDAENRVKRLMSNYTMEQERIRQEREAEIRRKQREEAERQAREAEALEAQGKHEEAEAALEIAAQIEDIKPVVEIAQPKVQGVSYQTAYEVEVENISLVPAEISGMVIRPVDLGAVKRLATMAKGKIAIPGIRITETKIAKVRS